MTKRRVQSREVGKKHNIKRRPFLRQLHQLPLPAPDLIVPLLDQRQNQQRVVDDEQHRAADQLPDQPIDEVLPAERDQNPSAPPGASRGDDPAELLLPLGYGRGGVGVEEGPVPLDDLVKLDSGGVRRGGGRRPPAEETRLWWERCELSAMVGGEGQGGEKGRGMVGFERRRRRKKKACREGE